MVIWGNLDGVFTENNNNASMFNGINYHGQQIERKYTCIIEFYKFSISPRSIAIPASANLACNNAL